MSNPVYVVRAFCALMEQRDPEALRPLLADDAVYQNVGMPASSGVEAIAENMGAQFSMFPDAYAFEIVNIASDGPVVLTERLDYIQAPDGAKPAVPQMDTWKRTALESAEMRYQDVTTLGFEASWGTYVQPQRI
jgi:limonene-1,2-epoxide hydrolase